MKFGDPGSFNVMEVKVDGAEVEDCFEFDITEGWAKFYVRNSNGHYIQNTKPTGETYLVEGIKRGKVEVTFDEGSKGSK